MSQGVSCRKNAKNAKGKEGLDRGGACFAAADHAALHQDQKGCRASLADVSASPNVVQGAMQVNVTCQKIKGQWFFIQMVLHPDE
jgi:hypothetical protein